MQVDKTTLQDISIFHHEEELSVFHYLNFTQTNGGREYLRVVLGTPHDTLAAIKDAQQTIRHLCQVADRWPVTITNGTIMVIERYFETAINPHAPNPNIISALVYKLLNGPDYSIARYSVEHFVSFVKGLQEIVVLLQESSISKQLQKWRDRIEMLLKKPVLQDMQQLEKGHKLTPAEALSMDYFIRYHFRHEALELIDIFSRIDAYLGLAIAHNKYHFCFPNIEESEVPFISAEGLYHPLLTTPVSYDVTLNRKENFLFLTGANMAGKSTFIKAVGLNVYLAHLGMSVPSKSMQLSVFDGLLSNIQVADNIIKGESYFFNEVQRIKGTIEKISDGKKWLILIDELFKGTNVQDAMKCSTVVIEGLRKMSNVLFILSTHLYEIGEPLKQYNNIQFRFFETSIADDQLVFSYQLKEGISNDRLGYLILRKEGVVGMLDRL